MARQFFRVKFNTLEKMLAINASDIRAVLQLEGDKYQIWLASDLEIPADTGKRDPMLAGVTPLSKHTWQVSSSDLAELFKVAP